MSIAEKYGIDPETYKNVVLTVIDGMKSEILNQIRELEKPQTDRVKELNRKRNAIPQCPYCGAQTWKMRAEIVAFRSVPFDLDDLTCNECGLKLECDDGTWSEIYNLLF